MNVSAVVETHQGEVLREIISSYFRVPPKLIRVERLRGAPLVSVGGHEFRWRVRSHGGMFAQRVVDDPRLILVRTKRRGWRRLTALRTARSPQDLLVILGQEDEAGRQPLAAMRSRTLPWRRRFVEDQARRARWIARRLLW